jgi:hypothetical protein
MLCGVPIGFCCLQKKILENPPKKQQWKNAMKKAINSFWYDKWTNEKQIKSTLEYLEIQQNPIGTRIFYYFFWRCQIIFLERLPNSTDE